VTGWNWIDAWNADPNPFVWVKTADEILDSLAAYCARINRLSNLMIQNTSDVCGDPCATPVRLDVRVVTRPG
jgi:hypothetical protein